MIKAAFVQGRVNKEELDLRVGLAGTALGQGTSIGYVNDLGQVTGSYISSSGNSVALAGSPGRLTTVSDPVAPPFTTSTAAINDSGVVVGEWIDANGLFHGFTEVRGVFTPIEDPAGAEGTDLAGISNRGVIVGFYTDSNAVNHGFELTSAGPGRRVFQASGVRRGVFQGCGLQRCGAGEWYSSQ